MEQMLEEVFHCHATVNTKFHAVHAYVFLGFTLTAIGSIFSKSPQTIANWVKRWHVEGNLDRLSAPNNRKFTYHHRLWIKDFVDRDPLCFLHEIQTGFQQHFVGMTISVSTIYSILVHDFNYSKKVVERRSLQIRFDEICRFCQEINQIRPLHHQLIFLDEMGLDNRDMLRKRGWFLRGTTPTIRGAFGRSRRISTLAFLCNTGFVEVFESEGTFNRDRFMACLRELVNSKKIMKGSMFIMDGAKIHLDPNIVHYLRSTGLYVLFLPAYCPFYNPIEVAFAYVKQHLQHNHEEASRNDRMEICEAFLALSQKDVSPTFLKCGYRPDGFFDPWKAYDHAKAVERCETTSFETELSDEIASL